jgi:acetylornithine deacetylase/succinyl-diaminopimelate desuccinylase-like protein
VDWSAFDLALRARRRPILERFSVVPYANANNRQHSPNEHLRLDHLYQGVRTTARLLVELGE